MFGATGRRQYSAYGRCQEACMAPNQRTNGKKNGAREKNGRPATLKERRALNTRWVYAYQLDPPQPEPKFKKINSLVRQAQTTAQRGGHLWTGRIVVET